MKERIEMRNCPNPECLSDDATIETTTTSTSDDIIHFVSCSACCMEGPVSKSGLGAATVWNDLPRIPEGAEDEEEEDPQTITTLVRMLDETRTCAQRAGRL